MTTPDRGSFRVARAVFDHPVLRGDAYDRRSAWLSLIADAAWTPRTVNRANRLIRLERGELALSLRFLGEKWGWPFKSVARFIDTLAEHGMVEKRTESSRIGIIKITNYDVYQAEVQPRHTGDTRMGTRTGTPNGTPENHGNRWRTDIFENECADRDTPDGTPVTHPVSANRDKSNKQIKERSKNPSNGASPSATKVAEREIKIAFGEWWEVYPRKVEKAGALKKYTSIVKCGEATVAELLAGAKAYAEAKAGTESKYIKHPTRWLNAGCWADERTQAPTAKGGDVALDNFWREKLQQFQKDGTWSTGSLGPRPNEPGCRVSAHILNEFNIRPP